jgi:rare lipoprotein A (peptidoglycan hydrolase)
MGYLTWPKFILSVIIYWLLGYLMAISSMPELIVDTTPIPHIIKQQPHKVGVASYYDYTLKSGWSSVGHRVCATRDFKRGTTIRVTNLDNGKTVDCLVTDFGPDASIHPDRIVDLSSTAFSHLALLSSGLIKNVKIEKVK